MDIDKLTLKLEDGYFTPGAPIRFPFWEGEMDLWIDSEVAGQTRPSSNQYKALSQFLQLDPAQLTLLTEGLGRCKEALKAEQRVVKGSKKFSPDEVIFTVVIIPQQDRSPRQYVIVLADTTWKIPHRKFTIELEILFINNKFMLVQDMTGLWTRLEWTTGFNTENPIELNL